MTTKTERSKKKDAASSAQTIKIKVMTFNMQQLYDMGPKVRR